MTRPSPAPWTRWCHSATRTVSTNGLVAEVAGTRVAALQLARQTHRTAAPIACHLCLQHFFQTVYHSFLCLDGFLKAACEGHAATGRGSATGAPLVRCLVPPLFAAHLEACA